MLKPLLHFALALTLIAPVCVSAQPRERNGDRDRPERPERPDRERGERGPRGDRGERPEHGGRGEHGGPNDRPGRVPVDRIEEAFETIRELHPNELPKRLQMLERAIEKNPQAATNTINRFPRIFELMEMRKHRPGEFQLHVDQIQHTRKAFSLLKQIGKAREDNDQKKVQALREKLREQVRGIFQTRLEVKRIEIKRFKQRVEEAEKELAALEADQETLVAQKLEELEKRGPAGLREEGQGGPPPRDRGPDRRSNTDEDQEVDADERRRQEMRERLERLRDREEQQRKEADGNA